MHPASIQRLLRALLESLLLKISEESLVSLSGTPSGAEHFRLSFTPLSGRVSACGGHRTASEGRTRRFCHTLISLRQATAQRAAEDSRINPRRNRHNRRNRRNEGWASRL